MPPNSEPTHQTSFPELVYPSLRDNPLKSSEQWLKGKAMDDGAEGLWRIHNKLYDLTDFIKIHPGGEGWLRCTKVSTENLEYWVLIKRHTFVCEYIRFLWDVFN